MKCNSSSNYSYSRFNKLNMLLCLLTAQQCQTIHLIDKQFIKELPGKYQITIQQKLKQGTHLEPIILREFESERKLCVVAHLHEYLK